MSGPLGFRGWVGLLVLLHVALALLLWEPTMFEGGDNAGYMILGEALRTGEGYRDLHLPGEPLHARYPPVYPAILAALGWLGGLQLFKLASLAFTAGAVALTARLGRRMAGALPALAAAAVLAVNPVLLEYAHWTLSEAPFLFLVLTALTLLGADSPRAHAAGVGLAAAAFLTRTAGLPLLATAVLVPALRRRPRRALVAGGVGMAAAGGWALWQRLAAPGRPGYLAELLLRDPYQPAAGTVGPADLLARTAENVWTYVGSVLPESLAGSAGPATDAALLLGPAVAALALAGWILRATRGLGHPEVFMFLYAALIAAWPAVWTDRRFLLPLLPLLLLYAAAAASAAWGLVGAWIAGRRASAGDPGSGRAGGGSRRREGGEAARGDPPGRPAGAVALALLLAVPALAAAAEAGPERMRCMARYRAGSPCMHPALASFYEAARWARGGTPPDAVIANRKPTLFYWVGRRKGDVYRYSTEPELVLVGLEEMGATHVAVDALSATTSLYLLPAIRAYRDRFEVVHAAGEPPTAILRFRARAETASGAGAEPGARAATP